MSYEKKLYHRDSKGKKRVWWVTVDGDTVTVHHGIDGSDKIVTKDTKAKAKNKGKANETTPEEQAKLEAQSKWTKQVEREDYHWDVDQAGQQLRPMLARDYTKVGHQVDYDIHAEDTEGFSWCTQPKLDGLRLTYGWRYKGQGTPELLTRKGETYIVEHIAEAADKLIEIVSRILGSAKKNLRGLDGEIYKHGEPLNHIVSGAKKYHEGLTETLEYHMFDLVIDGIGFRDRYNILKTAVKELNDPIIQLVPTQWCHNEGDLKESHKHWASQGYEGVMLRDARSMYHMAARPNCLYKYKEFMDAEFEILDVWEDKNGCAMFTLHNPNGEGEHSKFDCTPKRSHKERQEMLENSDDYVGKWITVKFQDWTEYNVPQFPVGLGIRECDDNGNPIN